jgi:chromate reductase
MSVPFVDGFDLRLSIGKPVLVMSVSPAFTGGVRAHAQVNETLLAIHANNLSA